MGIAFDPLDGGCADCTWVKDNYGTHLEKKCELHQKIEDMQQDLHLERDINKRADYNLRRICDALNCGAEDDPASIAKTLVEEFRTMEDENSRLSNVVVSIETVLLQYHRRMWDAAQAIGKIEKALRGRKPA